MKYQKPKITVKKVKISYFLTYETLAGSTNFLQGNVVFADSDCGPCSEESGGSCGTCCSSNDSCGSHGNCSCESGDLGGVDDGGPPGGS